MRSSNILLNNFNRRFWVVQLHAAIAGKLESYLESRSPAQLAPLTVLRTSNVVIRFGAHLKAGAWDADTSPPPSGIRAAAGSKQRCRSSAEETPSLLNQTSNTSIKFQSKRPGSRRKVRRGRVGDGGDHGGEVEVQEGVRETCLLCAGGEEGRSGVWRGQCGADGLGLRSYEPCMCRLLIRVCVEGGLDYGGDVWGGGYGTLEELLEVITWAQLGIHNKPVGLLNVDGYYNSLLAFIDKAVEDGFIQPYQRHIFVSAPNAKDLVQKLEAVAPLVKQEYVPVEDALVAKLSWEMEQVGLNSTLQAEIAR
ncbi:hypothetical protein GW17_00049087 [Ensete ventricosum]|nr:hypothetical protein GW17_00049087 [Ensete ventricosum]